MKKTIAAITVALLLILVGCRERQSSHYDVSPYDMAMEDGKICIVVDAGHGIFDVGAINEENLGDITEADINFAIASLLYERLCEKGYTVIMTHDGQIPKMGEFDDGEEKYNPSERAEFANSTDADIFISVHCDSFPANPDVFGTRLYYCDTGEYDEVLSLAIGEKINGSFDYKEVIQKPMAKEDAYTVLTKTDMPSVLVECGFITNKDDAKRLIDNEWQNEFATAITSGIDKYFER